MKLLGIFIWLSVEFKHGDIEGLKLLNMLLPWQANSITEQAALIQCLLCFLTHVYEYCCRFQSVSPATQGCCIFADLCCLSYYFSTVSAAVLCIIYQALWMSPCTVRPLRLIYSFLSINHCLAPHFTIQMNILCLEGFTRGMINYWPVMKIRRCHNPSNSTLCRSCAQRLCFDNHGDRHVVSEQRCRRKNSPHHITQ